MIDKLLPFILTGQGAAPQGTPFFGSPIFLVVMIVIMFYFLLYKPDKKRRQERENMIKNLQRGDEVMTAGGVYGRITNITDNVVTLEIAPNVKVRASRQHVSTVAKQSEPETGPREESKKKGK